MSALLTMPTMPRKPVAKTTPVQCRLTVEEVDELDAIAAEQSIPVDRATLMAHVLREYLKRSREQAPAPKAGRSK